VLTAATLALIAKAGHAEAKRRKDKKEVEESQGG